jgi:lactate racemase
MRINLAYGTQQLPVDVPDNWINGRCYRPHPLKPCSNPKTELLAAVASIPAGQGLSAAAKGKGSCAIAVDGNEPILLQGLLPSLLELLHEETNLDPASITIVVGNRAWKPFNRATLKRLVDPGLMEAYRVVLHDPRDATSVVSTGTSSKGVPLTVNRHYAEAELKIVLGGVRPDLFFGFSGGRAVIMPGLSGMDTIRAMFSPEHVADKNARWGVFRDNPFHMTGIEAINAAGCHLAISATLTELGLVEKVFAGHFGGSHLQAMNAMKESLLVTVKEPMDIVVTTGGGDPNDRTLMQLVTALSAVEPVLKPGGTIVISGALTSGFGTQEFCDMLVGFGSVHKALDHLSKSRDFIPGQWIAQRFFSILQDHEVMIHNTDVNEDALWASGMTPMNDLNAAVHSAMESHGQRCKIVALPDGPFGINELAP